ncbi:uncharacterized protein LOC121784088 [Salvia splendens]|uniref:uncharacterized protein LOC121784088 n=1 Tax=Salvia splendens TaxID=180675 RepID=UPI001C275571|nr:uncharacterized protein LOC121784088 [Salvia splendens]
MNFGWWIDFTKTDVLSFSVILGLFKVNGQSLSSFFWLVIHQSVIPSNLQYAAIIALRRLPLDPGNPAFLHRAAQGVLFSDPVAVRHSLEILSELASKDLYAVAMALGNVQPGGALHDVLHLRDVLARVALAKLCHTVARARVLDGCRMVLIK